MKINELIGEETGDKSFDKMMKQTVDTKKDDFDKMLAKTIGNTKALTKSERDKEKLDLVAAGAITPKTQMSLIQSIFKSITDDKYPETEFTGKPAFFEKPMPRGRLGFRSSNMNHDKMWIVAGFVEPDVVGLYLTQGDSKVERSKLIRLDNKLTGLTANRVHEIASWLKEFAAAWNHEHDDSDEDEDD